MKNNEQLVQLIPSAAWVAIQQLLHCGTGMKAGDSIPVSKSASPLFTCTQTAEREGVTWGEKLQGSCCIWEKYGALAQFQFPLLIYIITREKFPELNIIFNKKDQFHFFWYFFSAENTYHFPSRSSPEQQHSICAGHTNGTKTLVNNKVLIILLHDRRWIKNIVCYKWNT